jgi:hypothetical protein
MAGWYFKKIHWWTSMIVAFVIGALPTEIFLWPLGILNYRQPQAGGIEKRWFKR